MDYSSLPSDPDHPVGGDPWQSSPRPPKTTFAPPEPESEPPSPLAKHAQSTREDVDQEDGEGSDQEPLESPVTEEPHRSNGAGKVPIRSNTSSAPDIRFQGPPMTEEELRQKQLIQQRQQERYQQSLHAQQHQRGPGPNRYHQGARAGQRQVPQYKLQAKITSIERTGKKDPAIRFDVHVCLVKAFDFYIFSPETNAH